MVRKGRGKVLTEDMNASENKEDGEDAASSEPDTGVQAYRDGNWVGVVNVVTVSCPSEADAVRSAFEIVLWRDDNEELNKCSLLVDIVRENEEMLCKADEGGKFGDLSSAAGAGRV